MPATDPSSLPVGHVDLEEAVRNIDGDRALFDTVALMVVTELPGYMDALRSHLSAGARSDARCMAHTIKGVAGGIGAFRLMALARQFEADDDMDARLDLGPRLAEFDLEAAAVVTRLRELASG